VKKKKRKKEKKKRRMHEVFEAERVGGSLVQKQRGKRRK
jgi:hypothetical protein